MNRILIILFVAISLYKGDFPDVLNNSIGLKHKNVSTKQIFFVIDDTYFKSLNADGVENNEGIYISVNEWTADFETSLKNLNDFNKYMYGNYKVIYEKPILINKQKSYVQEIFLTNYNHVIFHFLLTEGANTIYLKTGCPENMKEELEDILKTIAINY